MISNLKLIIIIFLLLPIYGCDYYMASFEDVSKEPPYSIIVNMTFKTKCDLYIDGYNLDSNPGKTIQVYSIKSPPLARNRYVLSRDKLPKGTLIMPIAVKRCTDCFLDLKPRIEVEVTSEALKQKYNLPIYIDGSTLVENWGHNGETFQVNTTNFE